MLENPEDYTKIERFPRESHQLWSNLPSFDPHFAPKPKWLINSFLAERSIQLVFGERGSFKSTFMLVAANSVANGEEFLGFKTRQRRVLYLDYENPPTVIKARNDDLRLDLSRSNDLKVWNRFGTQPTPRPEDPFLEEMIRDCVLEKGHGPWIIFDSWASLLPPGQGGEFTGHTAPIYLQLRKLADLGATVTVLDHSRKYDKNTIYGGQDKEAKADSIHNLTIFPNKTRPNNKIIRVESWLKRYAPEGEGSFAFEVQSEQDQKGDWHIAGLVPVQDPIEQAKLRNIEILRKLIRQDPNSGQEALASAAMQEGLSRDQAIKLLKDGAGKHWRVHRIGHNKSSYSLI
ncbi:MAG TPA: AAA family ATPase [Candidatus Eisenbacteria bacterium]|nr:AAA family ATPase [Candidatus Eisenbacteria bacterium]